MGSITIFVTMISLTQIQCLSEILETVAIGGDVSVQCNVPDSRALPPWVINGKHYSSTSLPYGMEYNPRNSTLTISNIQVHHHNMTIHCIHPVTVTPSNITKLYIINPTTSNISTADIASIIIQTSTALFASNTSSTQKENIVICITSTVAIFIGVVALHICVGLICLAQHARMKKKDVPIDHTTVLKDRAITHYINTFEEDEEQDFEPKTTMSKDKKVEDNIEPFLLVEEQDYVLHTLYVTPV